MSVFSRDKGTQLSLRLRGCTGPTAQTIRVHSRLPVFISGFHLSPATPANGQFCRATAHVPPSGSPRKQYPLHRLSFPFTPFC